MAKTHKSKSGKHGKLVDVVTDPNYGKDVRGNFKGKVFMSSTGDPSQEGKILMPEGISADVIKKTSNRLEGETHPDIIEAQRHNETILENDEMYMSLSIPPGTILVKLYKRVPAMKGATGLLYVEPTRLVKPSRAANDPGKGNETQKSPFLFESKGVVVKMSHTIERRVTDEESDSYWPRLVSGATVLIDPDIIKISTANFNYESWKFEPPKIAFVHPDDTKEEPGYVIIRTNNIKAVL